jgi:hypothetical protein
MVSVSQYGSVFPRTCIIGFGMMRTLTPSSNTLQSRIEHENGILRIFYNCCGEGSFDAIKFKKTGSAVFWKSRVSQVVPGHKKATQY